VVLVADEPFSPRNVDRSGVVAPTRDRGEQAGWRAGRGPGTGRNQSLMLVVVTTSDRCGASYIERTMR
jgi:hypothetical protein